jgi:hypothetical protein
MKVWIDKQGGLHYHKADCKMIGKPYHYEEIEHRIRRNKLILRNMFGEYQNIIVDKRRYHPCPLCFGDKRNLFVLDEGYLIDRRKNK